MPYDVSQDHEKGCSKFSSNKQSLYSFLFFNFNRFPETTASVLFGTIDYNPVLTTVQTCQCVHQTGPSLLKRLQKCNELGSINISNFYIHKGVHKDSYISFACRCVFSFISCLQISVISQCFPRKELETQQPE